MLNATNANQSTASQPQQAQPFQQPQPAQAQQAQAALARSRMAPAVLREAGSALVFAAGPLVPAASFGARIGSFLMKALASRTQSPEDAVRTTIYNDPNITLEGLKDIIVGTIEPNSYESVKLLFELITEFKRRQQIEHVKYLINKFPDLDADHLGEYEFSPVKIYIPSPREKAHIKILAEDSLKTFIPYCDNMSIDKEIEHIIQFKGNMNHKSFFYGNDKRISTPELAIKSVKFHAAHQNFDRAFTLYEKFVFKVYLAGDYPPEMTGDYYPQEMTTFFMDELFKHNEKLLEVVKRVSNISSRDILKTIGDYAVATPLAVILAAFKNIPPDCGAEDIFGIIGARWSLSLSPPQIEWASFARSKIDHEQYRYRDIARELDEKIAKAREERRRTSTR